MMADEQDRKPDPTTETESDISKAQSQQQPQGQADPQTGETRETGQDLNSEADRGQQAETLTDKRTDVEGASLESAERGEAESGFVGAEGKKDTSSELIEDEEFEEGGEGAPDSE